MKWTEVVSSFSAVGSALIAATAATFAYGAYRKQSGQLELAQRHDRRWQSAKVTAWIDQEETKEQNPFGFDVMSYLRNSADVIAYRVYNASDLPVYQVKLTGIHPRGFEIVITKFDTLEPTDESVCYVNGTWFLFDEARELGKTLYESLSNDALEEYRNKSYIQDLLFKKPGDYFSPAVRELGLLHNSVRQSRDDVIDRFKSTIMLSFRDCEGTWWIRKAGGRLEEL